MEEEKQELLEQIETPVYGNPEISELVKYFETKMALKMPQVRYQRRAAQTLIQRHGLQLVLRAVDAAAAARYKEYAPMILSLVELRDKWNKLVAYYQREAPSVEKTAAFRRVTGASS